ncbi:MAG: C40 family peptidase [Sphingobium sp.]
MTGQISPARVAPPEPIRFRLTGRSVTLDGRVHAVRPDLADISLAGTLFSAHYARAVAMTCVAAGSAVVDTPSPGAQAISQLLRGETFHALDVTTHWTWGFCGHDGYVGYVRRDALDVLEIPTHRVVGRPAPLFISADIKAPITAFWPTGALFKGLEEGDFVDTGEGFLHRRHAAPVDALENDWVAAAERHLGQPYVWGGRGHRGVDCSGLVQAALGRCGMRVPRDTDLQREGIGTPVPAGEAPRRGDLVFFPGHVGIMIDAANLLHANAHWMAVVAEPLADVVGRLAPTHAEPILAIRRIMP